MTHDTGEFEGMCPTCGQPYCWAEIERLKAKIAVIEEAALAAYRYHMLGYKDADAFNANVMLDHMNKLGEVL